jgi:amidase
MKIEEQRGFLMDEMTIHDLQAEMDSGKMTARSITEMYLERIETVDHSGPSLKSVIEVNPDALIIADSFDTERKASGVRGPMHGIPVLLKDIIDTADKMTTTAGSIALEGSIPSQDSYVAQRLRHAGAVIVGKTNLSEWSNFRSTRSSSGWSSRGGQTRNPYALDRNPCGSSSGSAVAVAANLCSVAVGCETDGSIICPSQANAVVGLKPTLGLISRSGIIPIAHSQDTAGPMARTVTDLAILLGALVGVDPLDPATKSSKGKFFRDYTQFLDPKGLQGAKIGVARNFFGFNERVDQIIESCIGEMKSLGAVIIDPANIENVDELRKSEIEVLYFEFKTDLNEYLEGLGPDVPVHSLKELINFNEENKEKVMPYFGQERMLASQEKGPLSSEEYLQALKTSHRLSREEGIDRTLQAHQLDAIVAPSGGPAWLIDWVAGDNHSGSSSSPAAVAGYPNITVSAGYIFGLPVGISFIGGAYQEPKLLKLAYAFEQGTRIRKPPQYLASADLSI